LLPVDEQTIHAQFVNIALSLTPPLLRNLNVTDPKEAVALYMQVYDSVIQAAIANEEKSTPPAAAPE
jgi:hypothetical protein